MYNIYIINGYPKLKKEGHTTLRKNVDVDSDKSYITMQTAFKMPSVMAHAFIPSTQEAEAGGSLSLKTAWSTE